MNTKWAFFYDILFSDFDHQYFFRIYVENEYGVFFSFLLLYILFFTFFYSSNKNRNAKAYIFFDRSIRLEAALKIVENIIVIVFHNFCN